MNRLLLISHWLSSKASYFIIAIAIVTFFFPEIFTWVKGNTQTIILGLIMLTMGLTLSTQDFKILAKRPLDILIGACAWHSIRGTILAGIFLSFDKKKKSDK